jgi:biotin carboxylase
MAATVSNSRPLVVIGYGPRCVSLVELTRVAGALCDVTWLVDESIPEMAQMRGFLGRFGSVVNIDGRSQEQIADAVSSPRSPDALVTFLDRGMVTFARVSEILGVPFHSVDTARALTDKAYQRERLAAAGLDSTHCQVVTTQEISVGHVTPDAELGWPVVLKPRSSQGSYYTFLAKDGSHLDSLVKLIADDCPEMVLESYIPDDPSRSPAPYASYVSVESVVSQGEISHLAVTGRFPLAENFRETGFFLPAALTNGDESQALELAGSAIEALGVRTGSLHTEIKFSADGPRVVEVNGRVGGGVPEMLSRAANLDLLDITLRIALGESINVKGPVPTDMIGYRFFLQPPPVSAVVANIEGLDALSEFPGVDSISVHQRPGAELDWKDGSRNHILSVVGSVSNYEDLQAVSRIINEVVKVSYINIRRD